MSLAEEKKLIKEIEQLKQSKKTAAQYVSQEEVTKTLLSAPPRKHPNFVLSILRYSKTAVVWTLESVLARLKVFHGFVCYDIFCLMVSPGCDRRFAFWWYNITRCTCFTDLYS